MKDYTFTDYKDMVEEHLMNFIPDIDHKSITLYESMKYSLSSGGKRIRPVLLLAACDFCGGKVEEARCLLGKSRHLFYPILPPATPLLLPDVSPWHFLDQEPDRLNLYSCRLSSCPVSDWLNGTWCFSPFSLPSARAFSISAQVR